VEVSSSVGCSRAEENSAGFSRSIEIKRTGPLII